MTDDDVYRGLQRHLDALPVGFPPTVSGVEIRILKHLFTPDEAALASYLSIIPEPLGRIHARIQGKMGISLQELEGSLDTMFRKGTVLMRSDREEKCYSNAMLIVGMFELQVERLTNPIVARLLYKLTQFGVCVDKRGVISETLNRRHKPGLLLCAQVVQACVKCGVIEKRV